MILQMKNLKKLSIIGIFFFIFLAVILSSQIGPRGKISQIIKSNLSSDFKNFLKRTIFVHKYNSILINEIRNLNDEISSKNFLISELVDQLGKISFYNSAQEDIFIKEQKYILKKFRTDLLVKSYPYSTQSSSYIDFYNDKIWIATAKGTFLILIIKILIKKNLHQI